MKKQKLQLFIAFFVPVITALLLRLWDLDLRPFHSDEGVNSHFLLNLFNKNHYHYNPANYHGPFLYYIGLIPFYILGVTNFSFRIMPALFGIMVVALLYPLHKRIGKTGLLTTGLLLAISPANSFFARDTIHETYLVFFTLAVVVSFFLYAETRKTRYIYFAASSLALVITIKETYIITFAVFALSLAIAYGYEIIFLSRESINTQLKRIFSAFTADCKQRKYTIGISIGLFLLINFLFYSSFFTYYEGIHGILTTLKIWTKTGTHSSGHVKPFFYYFKLLYKFELPILVLGVAGIFYAFKARNKLTVFVVSWAMFIYGIYSFIPYKTPWLVINIILPIAILAGICVQGIWNTLKKKWRYVVFVPVYTCIFGLFCYQSILLNFVTYDDERYELVYVQTKRDVYNLVNRLKLLSDKCGKNITINIVSKEYWPLPWYLRSFKRANFWGKVIKNPNAPVVIVGKKGEKEVKEKLKGKYEKERFVLRPGVWLTVYIQEALYNTVFGGHASREKATTQLPVDISGEELVQGLEAQYYYNIECIGEPFESRIETEPISFTYNNDTQKPYRSPFSVEWEGFIHITKEGIYQFATKSDDGSHLFIDGKHVVDNGDPHALRYISGVIPLDKGYHAIRLKYFDIGGGAILELLWTPPGGKEELVPSYVFFHSPL